LGVLKKMPSCADSVKEFSGIAEGFLIGRATITLQI
jgi:hypothetical protein